GAPTYHFQLTDRTARQWPRSPPFAIVVAHGVSPRISPTTCSSTDPARLMRGGRRPDNGTAGCHQHVVLCSTDRTPSTAIPVSACFRAKAICSSVDLDFFMST